VAYNYQKGSAFTSVPKVWSMFIDNSRLNFKDVIDKSGCHFLMLKLFSKPTIQCPSADSCFTHSLQCWMQGPRLEIFFWNPFSNDINLLGVVTMQEVLYVPLLCPWLRWLLVHRQAKMELIIFWQDCWSLNEDTIDFLNHYISWELADVMTESPHWFGIAIET